MNLPKGPKYASRSLFAQPTVEVTYFYFRFDKGSYQGVDESNVKLEVTCIKFPPARKVSKMLNGLGDAM